MGAVVNDRHEDAGPYVLGAALAALILPALVLGLSAPLWLGVIVAFAVLAGVVGAGTLRRRRERTLASAGALAPVRLALADAEHALTIIHSVAGAIRAPEVRRQAHRIAGTARIIIGGVDADPGALSEVQRVLTYYLPRTATLLESYRILEARGDAARLTAIEAIVARLDTAFQHYADRLADDDLRLLDMELRLVDAALKDDLGDGGSR